MQIKSKLTGMIQEIDQETWEKFGEQNRQHKFIVVNNESKEVFFPTELKEPPLIKEFKKKNKS